MRSDTPTRVAARSSAHFLAGALVGAAVGPVTTENAVGLGKLVRR